MAVFRLKPISSDPFTSFSISCITGCLKFSHSINQCCTCYICYAQLSTCVICYIYFYTPYVFTPMPPSHLRFKGCRCHPAI